MFQSIRSTLLLPASTAIHPIPRLLIIFQPLSLVISIMSTDRHQTLYQTRPTGQSLFAANNSELFATFRAPFNLNARNCSTSLFMQAAPTAVCESDVAPARARILALARNNIDDLGSVADRLRAMANAVTGRRCSTRLTSEWDKNFYNALEQWYQRERDEVHSRALPTSHPVRFLG